MRGEERFAARDQFLPRGRTGLRRGRYPVADLLLHLPDDRPKEVVLAGEVVVERTLGHSESLDDVA